MGKLIVWVNLDRGIGKHLLPAASQFEKCYNEGSDGKNKTWKKIERI